MFYQVAGGRLTATEQASTGMAPIVTLGAAVLTPQLGELHYHFHAWGENGLSPGAITADRVWCAPNGELAFRFVNGVAPQPLTHVGLARELAAWLVLLDKWMDTYTVVRQAQRRWSTEILGGALGFLTPAFLPAALVAQPPDNWQRVADALALVAGGIPLPVAAASASTSEEPQP
jgi:hypothetical protein